MFQAPKVGSLPTMNNSSLRILLLSLRYFTSFVYCFRSSLFSLAFEIILNIFPPTCQDFSCYHLVSTHVVFKVRPILSPSLFLLIQCLYPFIQILPNFLLLQSFTLLCSQRTHYPILLGPSSLPKLLPTCIGFQSIIEKNRFSKPLSAHSL